MLSEVEVLVIETMVMRLGITASLAWLKSHGHEMKHANYYKIRARIQATSDKRKFDFIRQGGLYNQHMERIDQLETILRLSWENFHREGDNFKRQKILESITMLQPLLSKYYEATQYIIEHEAKTSGIKRHLQSGPERIGSDEQFFII